MSTSGRRLVDLHLHGFHYPPYGNGLLQPKLEPPALLTAAGGDFQVDYIADEGYAYTYSLGLKDKPQHLFDSFENMNFVTSSQ